MAAGAVSGVIVPRQYQVNWVLAHIIHLFVFRRHLIGHSPQILPPPPRIDRYSIICSSVVTGEAAAARKRLISVDVWSDFARMMYVFDVK